MISHPSPNQGARRDGLSPTLIVLHYTAMESAKAALDRLCDPAAEVSAHYLIARNGDVYHLVPETQRAWHAGAGAWHGQDDVNSRSIGIELDNRGDHPFSEPLMRALEVLLAQVMARWNIPPEGVIGHSDMAPVRKADPGPHFDWSRLARQELALAAERYDGGVVTRDAFRSAAAQFGYEVDVPFETLLQAARLRFAPWRNGPLCAEDFVFPTSSGD